MFRSAASPGAAEDPCGAIPLCGERNSFKLQSEMNNNEYLEFRITDLTNFGFYKHCADLNGCHVRLVQNPQYGTELEWDNDMWYVLFPTVR